MLRRRLSREASDMDITAIFALIAKGISVATNLLEAGKAAAPALQALENLVKGAQAGTVTDQDLADTEALLDGMIAEFNSDQ